MGFIHNKVFSSFVAGIFVFSLYAFSSDAVALESNNIPAGDERPSIVAMGLDFLVVRPLTFALTVGGGVFWFVTLPVTAIGGNVGEAGDKLFIDPARYTFVRPLGHMEMDNSPVLGDTEEESTASLDQ